MTTGRAGTAGGVIGTWQKGAETSVRRTLPPDSRLFSHKLSLAQTLDSITLALIPSSESTCTTKKAVRQRLWQHSLLISKLSQRYKGHRPCSGDFKLEGILVVESVKSKLSNYQV